MVAGTLIAMIQIVDYRATWPEEFAVIGAALRETLGPVALAIHHIGSTSVPGLEAKDVIDIQVTVERLDAFENLESAGFWEKTGIVGDHCPPGMTMPPQELAKRLFGNDGVAFGGRRIHLHVREEGRFNQRYPLLCRDYLRAHPFAAQAYVEIKRQLARYFPGDVDAYYAIKDPVFDVLMEGAREWAERTGWKVPSTDA